MSVMDSGLTLNMVNTYSRNCTNLAPACQYIVKNCNNMKLKKNFSLDPG